MLKIKLSAVIITYYPDFEKLSLSVKQIFNHIDLLIIWDNTPMNIECDFPSKLGISSNKVKILSEAKNMGIGYAINKAIAFSKTNDMSHLMTLDQDSFFKESEFMKYKAVVENLIHNNEIGIFAPNIINIFSQKKTPLFSTVTEVQFVEKVISSGSIYRLNEFNKTGFFREDLFIDEVDFEYCYRINRLNYKIAIVSNAFLLQSFSEMKQIKTFFYITNYTAFRLYHIIRNGIIVKREYPEISSSWFNLITKSIFLRCIKICLFEKNRYCKLRAILLGIFDGISNNYNKNRIISKK